MGKIKPLGLLINDNFLHVLRNPHGWSDADIKQAQLNACEAYERMIDCADTLREFCEKNGLDTAVYSQDVGSKK